MTTQSTDMPLSFLKSPPEVTVGLNPTETDEFLLGRLREGDAKAGEMLVLRYHDPLKRYLYRISGQWSVAEELHQQTWLSVLEHLEKFDPSSSSGGFKAWLFRIATNKAKDMWRSQGRHKAALDGLKTIQNDHDLPAGAGLEYSEQETKLRQAIAKLPEAQRQVLLLRYYSGLKFTEIAELLGCPLNTALGRMHKALIKLKEIMESP